MISKPSWKKKWRHMPHLDLWQATALSLDVDPDSIEFSAGINGSYHAEARDRLQILEANFNSSHRDPRLESVLINHKGDWRSGGGYQTRGVSTRGFASWAVETWGETPPGVPPELAQLANPRHSTAQLEVIIADQKDRIESLQAENARLLAELDSSRQQCDAHSTARTDHAIIGGLMHILTNAPRKKTKAAVIGELVALGKRGLSTSTLDRHPALKKRNFKPADMPDSEGIAAELNKPEE